MKFWKNGVCGDVIKIKVGEKEIRGKVGKECKERRKECELKRGEYRKTLQGEREIK